MNKLEGTRSTWLAYLNKVTRKETKIGFEEIDGKIQALAWSFDDSFGVPATKASFKKDSKEGEETS